MPRNMSFSLTTEQIKDRTKTVTRRKGWERLKVGDTINACVKCMGLKKGEKPERLALIQVTGVSREPLHWISAADVRCEGFDMLPAEFVDMFCRHMGGDQNQVVTRIEFKYL